MCVDLPPQGWGYRMPHRHGTATQSEWTTIILAAHLYRHQRSLCVINSVIRLCNLPVVYLCQPSVAMLGWLCIPSPMVLYSFCHDYLTLFIITITDCKRLRYVPLMGDARRRHGGCGLFVRGRRSNECVCIYSSLLI